MSPIRTSLWIYLGLFPLGIGGAAFAGPSCDMSPNGGGGKFLQVHQLQTGVQAVFASSVWQAKWDFFVPVCSAEYYRAVRLHVGSDSNMSDDSLEARVPAIRKTVEACVESIKSLDVGSDEFLSFLPVLKFYLENAFDDPYDLDEWARRRRFILQHFSDLDWEQIRTSANIGGVIENLLLPPSYTSPMSDADSRLVYLSSEEIHTLGKIARAFWNPFSVFNDRLKKYWKLTRDPGVPKVLSEVLEKIVSEEENLTGQPYQGVSRFKESVTLVGMLVEMGQEKQVPPKALEFYRTFNENPNAFLKQVGHTEGLEQAVFDLLVNSTRLGDDSFQYLLRISVGEGQALHPDLVKEINKNLSIEYVDVVRSSGVDTQVFDFELQRRFLAELEKKLQALAQSSREEKERAQRDLGRFLGRFIEDYFNKHKDLVIAPELDQFIGAALRPGEPEDRFMVALELWRAIGKDYGVGNDLLVYRASQDKNASEEKRGAAKDYLRQMSQGSHFRAWRLLEELQQQELDDKGLSEIVNTLDLGVRTGFSYTLRNYSSVFEKTQTDQIVLKKFRHTGTPLPVLEAAIQHAGERIRSLDEQELASPVLVELDQELENMLLSRKFPLELREKVRSMLSASGIGRNTNTWGKDFAPENVKRLTRQLMTERDEQELDHLLRIVRMTRKNQFVHEIQNGDLVKRLVELSLDSNVSEENKQLTIPFVSAFSNVAKEEKLELSSETRASIKKLESQLKSLYRGAKSAGLKSAILSSLGTWEDKSTLFRKEFLNSFLDLLDPSKAVEPEKAAETVKESSHAMGRPKRRPRVRRHPPSTAKKEDQQEVSAIDQDFAIEKLLLLGLRNQELRDAFSPEQIERLQKIVKNWKKDPNSAPREGRPHRLIEAVEEHFPEKE